MKTLVLLLFCLLGVTVNAQIDLTIEDSTAVNTDPNAGPLIDIPRDVPTNLIFRNNSLTSNVKNSYMLRCGDDLPRGDNNNLDGAIISGNYFNYTGTDPSALCHGVMMGYNINYHFRYNYCKWIPFGLVYEGIEGMTTTEGGTYYNVLRKGRTNQIILNGQNGVPVYNNTLYSSRPAYSFITVKVLGQVTPTATSNNIKIKNNIFYSVEDNNFIGVDDSALVTLECDYNVYWCENSVNNEPKFQNISTYEFYTWDEWRALGFDEHSVIINPNFIDTENLVPAARLDYGTDLGSAYDEGLAIDAVWDVGEYPNTTKQNGTWQVGAYVYSGSAGLESNKDDEILNIFPNPNDGKFTFNFVESWQDGSYRIDIINYDGVVVYEGTLENFENFRNFDLSYVDSGIYLVVISDNEKVVSRKFIKR